MISLREDDDDYDADTDDEIKAANEGLRYLVRWRDEMQAEKVASIGEQAVTTLLASNNS
jgi:hypothetical protein